MAKLKIKQEIIKLASTVNELRDEVNKLRDDIEILQNRVNNEEKTRRELSARLIEWRDMIDKNFSQIADMIDMLRLSNKRCALCGRIMGKRNTYYIGVNRTSYDKPRLRVQDDKNYLIDPIEICEKCAKLPLSVLAAQYGEVIRILENKEE